MRKIIAVAALCLTPSIAMAGPYAVTDLSGYDPYAADAISRADYDAAEARLVRRLADNESDVPAMLNLAAVLTETNRVVGASSLLAEVLDADNVLLESADGTPVWSHDAATTALRSRVIVGSRD